MNDLTLAKKYVQKAQSSADRGIEFSLSLTSYRNLMRAKKCYYTDVPLTDGVGPNRRTIDRIDCKKGYVKGNVVACSHRINRLKNSWESDRVSLDLVEKVLDKTKKRVGVV